jgi:dsRNA-specific ribonuclease
VTDVSEELRGHTPEAPASFEELLARLEGMIGYAFRDRALLRRALTHRSFANEQAEPRPLHNEALEFLGDAVLEFLISAWLLELHPMQSEGTLSKLRAYAVSAANLQKHAARLRLGDYLLLNRGEEKTGGRSKSALQVDAYEALIAAIYLDGGIPPANDFVRRQFGETLAGLDPQNLTATDYAPGALAVARPAHPAVCHRREPRPRPPPHLPGRVARQRPAPRHRPGHDHQRGAPGGGRRRARPAQLGAAPAQERRGVRRARRGRGYR